MSPLPGSYTVCSIEFFSPILTLLPPLYDLPTGSVCATLSLLLGYALVPRPFFGYFDLKEKPRPGNKKGFSFGSRCVFLEMRAGNSGGALAATQIPA